jgi:hypothetical protein
MSRSSPGTSSIGLSVQECYISGSWAQGSDIPTNAQVERHTQYDGLKVSRVKELGRAEIRLVRKW